MRMLRGIERPGTAIVDRMPMRIPRRVMGITREILVDVLVIVLLNFLVLAHGFTSAGSARTILRLRPMPPLLAAL
jgi:hypothetical protein